MKSNLVLVLAILVGCAASMHASPRIIKDKTPKVTVTNAKTTHTEQHPTVQVEAASTHTSQNKNTRASVTRAETIQTTEQKPKPSVDEDDVEVAIVLTNFAQIVNHFIHIVKDPKTTSTVAQGVGGIICNIGTIIAQAIRSGVIRFDSETESGDYRSAVSKAIVELKKELAQRKKDCGCGCHGNCGK